MIDWVRIAEPQNDHYDTDVILDIVHNSPPRALTPYPNELHGGERRIFDDSVTVGYMAETPEHPNYYDLNGPIGDTLIDEAVEFVRRWEPAFDQFRRIMARFHPLAARTDLGRLGSMSHSSEQLFGTMFATVSSSHALAQAFVHEMGHNKLRALGIFFESAEGLILNAPDEMFASPIRKDKPRPMMAVLHAQYSFMHVTALDIANLEAEIASGEHPDRMKNWVSLLARNTPRMEEGYPEIQRNIRLDENGREFIDGFFAWSDRVLARGNELLMEYGTMVSRN